MRRRKKKEKETGQSVKGTGGLVCVLLVGITEKRNVNGRPVIGRRPDPKTVALGSFVCRLFSEWIRLPRSVSSESSGSASSRPSEPLGLLLGLVVLCKLSGHTLFTHSLASLHTRAAQPQLTPTHTKAKSD